MADSNLISRDNLVFFHAPNSRSAGARILLEELGAKYELRAVNMTAGEQQKAPYLAVNPLGKVPALLHDGELITEQVAIYIYLADLYPEAGLAPAIGDRQRGPYLRWLAFYGSSFEPALLDRALKHAPAPAAMSPYGTFDAVLETVVAAIRKGPYLLGDRLSAADILWGTALKWTTGFKLVPELPEITTYLARIWDRPVFARVTADDAQLAAIHKAEAAAAS